MHNTCPMCEEGTLTRAERTESIKIEDQYVTDIVFEYSVCSVCGSEITSPKQVKSNQAKACDAKRMHRGLLTGDMIHAIRDSYGLTQSKAALIFGGGQNSFSKYERGEVVQSSSMDKLLRVASEHPSLVVWLTELATGSEIKITRSVVVKSKAEILVESHQAGISPKSLANVISLNTLTCANQSYVEWETDTEPQQFAANG